MTINASIIPFPRFSHDTQAYSGLTVNLSAIVHNYKIICALAEKSTIAAVVKSNAYGTGAAPVSRALYGAGCRDFFVAYLDEAYEVKQAINGAEDARIFVLNGFLKGTEREFIAEGFIPVLTDSIKVERWHDATAHKKEKYPCVLHIDTGMNRTGIRMNDIPQILPMLPELNVYTVMSHLACNDRAEHPLNAVQKNRFDDAFKMLDLTKNTLRSFVSSKGILIGSDYHYDLCRPGVAILAGYKNCPYDLKTTIKVWARIYQIQMIEAGETVGYGATYQAKERRKIATITFGHADGYPAHPPGADVPNYAMIGSHKAPIVGLTSMDLITVDVTDVPEHLIFENAVVELVNNDITIHELAEWSGRHAYELMLKFGQRLQRNYVEF